MILLILQRHSAISSYLPHSSSFPLTVLFPEDLNLWSAHQTASYTE
jgi:hypothetical protein